MRCQQEATSGPTTTTADTCEARRERRISQTPLLFAALLLVSFNMRTTITSLPPLEPELARSLALSSTAAGALSALPVICMALFAPAGHQLARRRGGGNTALAGIAMITVGNGLRILGSVPELLFAGTLFAGIGIALCAVAVPGIVKHAFPGRSGAATGAYAVALMLGATAASALSVPIEHAFGSWQVSLASWALPAALAGACWLPLLRRAGALPPHREASERHRRLSTATIPAPGLPWRSRPAWLLSGFLALQSSTAYVFLAWLAPAYQARGMTATAAGALLGLINFAQIGTALILPATTDRINDGRLVLVGTVALSVSGALWLLVAPGLFPWLATALLGLGLGGGFSLGLVLVVDLGASAAASARLSGMVFLVCYTAGALAPIAAGVLHDAAGGYVLPFALGVVTALAQLSIATRLTPALRGTVS